MGVLYNEDVMKVHVEADPRSKALYWYSDDKKFYGPIVEPFALDDRQGYHEEFPAGALLSVPRSSPGERPSFNEYSPLIVQAPTVQELIPKLETWVDENSGKKHWDLRRKD
jgi:hypothetical protein